MSRLSIDQRTIMALFADKKTNFLIPDYQRPYAWGDQECQQLWVDLFDFAIPENEYGERDADKFDTEEEYYLGPIVTFKNDKGLLEIIDGQQRLTTLMLLLRAFYTKFGKMADPKARTTKAKLEQCIWKVDEDDNFDIDELKITSEVATEDSKEEFLEILKTGNLQPSHKSQYAKNYKFFLSKIEKFKEEYASYFTKLPTRILNNCILLPIEADDQNTALRIFSTLNDRGKPLSDADIFKAQFYKHFSAEGGKDEFIKRWKDLELLCNKIFHPIYGTPLDEIFSQYMYYRRAKLKIKNSSTEALRKFYEKDSYAILKEDSTFDEICELAEFWSAVKMQDAERFSEEVLRLLYVLEYAPNSMWAYFLSVYYMTHRDKDGALVEKDLLQFLHKTTAMVWGYAFTHPGVNALRTPVYAEMVNLTEGLPVTFDNFKFDENQLRNAIDNYEFSNVRPLTKSMLTWWAFQNTEQKYLSLNSNFEIEHIYARKRQEDDGGLTNPKNIESLGNKSVLESRINIRAADFRFADKIKYYIGYTRSGVNQKDIEGTSIIELRELASTKKDFTEKDIEARYSKIIDAFIEYVRKQNLIV